MTHHHHEPSNGPVGVLVALLIGAVVVFGLYLIAGTINDGDTSIEVPDEIDVNVEDTNEG